VVAAVMLGSVSCGFGGGRGKGGSPFSPGKNRATHEPLPLVKEHTGVFPRRRRKMRR